MGAKVIRSISDLTIHSVWLELRCVACGRVASFDVCEMEAMFKARGWNCALEAAPWKFRCRCGSKRLIVGWSASRVSTRKPAPHPLPRPVDEEYPPPGCSADRFARAAHWQRERIREQYRPPGVVSEQEAEWRRQAEAKSRRSQAAPPKDRP